MKRNTLAFRLSLSILPLMLALSFILAGSSYWIARRTLLTELDKGVAAVSDARAARVKAFFDQRKVEIATIASSPLFRDYHKNLDYGLMQEAEVYRRELSRMLEEFNERTGAYARIRYVVGGRAVVRAGMEGAPEPAIDRELQGKLGSGGRLTALESRRASWHADPLVTYAAAVYAEDGKALGTLVLDCSLGPVLRFLEGLRLGKTGRSYLVEAKNAASWSQTVDMGESFARWADVEGTRWAVLTAVRRDEFLGPLSAIGAATLVISLLAFCGTALIIGRRLSVLLAPVRQLADAAGRFSTGDLAARVEPKGTAELATLAEAFNTMAGRLQQRLRELLSLQRMNEAVMHQLGRKEIARACLEAAVSGLGFDRGVLYWVDHEAGLVVGECAFGTEPVGFTDEQIRRRRVPLDSKDILAEVARTGKALTVSDPSTDPRCNPEFVSQVRTSAFSLAPIAGRERVLGIIGVDRAGGPVPEERLASLSLFCGAAGLALENARSEERYRSSVENSPEAVIGLDGSQRVVLWNNRACELFGWTAAEAKGRTLEMILDAADYERLRGRSVRQAEASGRAKDGRRLELSVSWSGQDSESHVVIQDLTEKKRLQSQLIQAEKMSAVGSLIAGVAHELNNPLQGVTGYAELAVESAGTPEQKSDLSVLHESAMRCRDIVRDLLRFVRQERRTPERVSLNEVARDTLRLMEYRITRRDGISLEVDLDPREPQVAGEFAKLQQVAVNLLSNACDAMNGQLGRRMIRLRTRIEDGRSRLVVDDSGKGVPSDMRLRIFDPFFTTKAPGHGTGLGLSVSSQIIGELDGRLVCEESPEGGARFVVCLPPCPEEVLRRPSAGSVMPEPVPGSRVLVVDDEPDLVRLMLRLLAEDGLVATPARSVDEALDRLRAERYDLVVTDVEMGERRGLELRGKAPRILFVTGDILNSELYRELSGLEAHVLHKPFLRTEFIRAVRRTLARRVA